jgi:outer membrane protein OmpA-like peptidoglycan-associated protein/tetratricopeptide (TPR) repeat protein
MNFIQPIHYRITKLPLWILICFLFSTQYSYSQWYNPEKLPKKTRAVLNEALGEINNYNYEKAALILEKGVQKDPRFLDGYLIRAGIYSQQKKYKPAVEFYEKAVFQDTVYARGYMLVYSIALAGNGQFEKAAEAVTRYLQQPNLSNKTRLAALKQKATYQFAIDDIQKRQHSNYMYSPKNMGNNINSRFSEYFPVMTVDRSMLIYTRKGETRNEDFFSSIYNGSEWASAAPLAGNLNTANNEGAQTISQDGKTLLFTGCDMEDGYGSCDIFISYLNENKWSKPINLGASVNTENWESQPSLSPDQQTLYFTSSIPKGYGGSDLYYSQILPNGTWSAPVNMGPDFNTPGDESSPFIHADNETFYFASNGLPGYGGTDLFICRKQADGKWGKPENLGYPINTIDDEGTLFVSADGKTGFFASDGMDSRGGLDLFTFELPEYAQPQKTLWIKGKVFDKKTLNGVPSMVELKDLERNETTCKIQTKEDGTYLIPMPVGKTYAFNVNRKGYLFFSENFSMKDKFIDSGYVVDIALTPIELNASITLKNIFFETGKSTLQTVSFYELNKLTQLLIDNPTLKIEIIGHTDNVGKENDNMTLSIQRASAVVNYLVMKGIDRKRLNQKGMGSTQPVAENDHEEGRAQNRRTEVKVLSL